MNPSIKSCLFIGIVLLVGSPLIAFGLTTIGMFRTFRVVTDSSTVSPADVATSVSNAMQWNALGLIGSILGGTLTVAALVAHFLRRCRTRNE